MIDNIPTWLSVPLIVVLWATVAYKFWILPTYEKDKRKKIEKCRHWSER